ncbi:MAG: hypothetical protein ACYC1D_08660 [Acidimicrobiales bacterium]
MEVAKVDGATLDAFYGQLQRGGLSALTVRKSHAILSGAFSQAIRWGWIEPHAYVWSQELDGATPYRPDRVTGAFRSLRDRSGLKHVTFHALRHFAATTSPDKESGCAPSPGGSATPIRGSPCAPTPTSSTPPTAMRLTSSAQPWPAFTRPRPAEPVPPPAPGGARPAAGRDGPRDCSGEDWQLVPSVAGLHHHRRR